MFLRTEKSIDVALEPAVLRQEDDARAQRVARRPDGHLPAVHEDPAGGVRVGAVDQPDQLAAAGADKPGNPKELAPAEAEAGVLDDVGQGQALDAQQLLVAHGLRGDAALAALGRGLGAPRDVLDQPLLGELLGAPRVDDAAVAHDRDVVGDLEDLVEAVRDVDDRDVALLEQPHDAVEVVDLCVRQRRGRLVEDEQACVGGEAPREHHQPPLRDAEAGDERIGVQPRAEHLEGVARLAAQALAVDEDSRLRRIAQAELDVLGHGQVGHVGELLVDDRDAELRGVARAVDGDRLAVDQDLAGVRLQRAREDLDHRALAGAVLAEQAEHDAGADGTAEVVEREHPRIALHEVAHDEERLVAGRDLDGAGERHLVTGRAARAG